jgi:hypothetical protein
MGTRSCIALVAGAVVLTIVSGCVDTGPEPDDENEPEPERVGAAAQRWIEGPVNQGGGRRTQACRLRTVRSRP